MIFLAQPGFNRTESTSTTSGFHSLKTGRTYTHQGTRCPIKSWPITNRFVPSPNKRTHILKCVHPNNIIERSTSINNLLQIHLKYNFLNFHPHSLSTFSL
ncbi:hypothetical protein HanXRQr2_Chr11g0472741 [Helianthus annuus]|uniref:Uncharacterized protein n=1 Tax=Helianthus annuus TaxID=4232 RepID=A0A9K3MYN1_HELAN|nr:hypothetical protein HanXRQr2_Chr11g0472741 [Helianthus annuus]KAJ0873737.1 hypothetical protein HanPSC8_Chr11g0455891 [Helianthus annuus]